ncbi:MAG: alpha/beta hydrolase [Puniceicoccales bacterium]
MSGLAAEENSEEKLEASGWQPVHYKTVGDTHLKFWHLPPQTNNQTKPAAAMVLFYGGGWRGRNLTHFRRQGEHLAGKGMHVFLPDYRAWKAYGGTPFDCVEDAKSAMRYIRQHAAEFNIDPNRIAAGGGSAGGHLAAACALVPGLNFPQDPDLSCRPDALVLFNPVYDNGPGGYGYNRVKDRWTEISPMHHINSNAPPNIVFLGTEDDLIPVTTGELWKAKMNEAGVRSELYLYNGRGHGFFNGGKEYTDTVEKMTAFLESLGYLQ